MPYGQLVQNVNLHRMWEEVSGIAEFSSRRLRVDEYNAANRYRKRGLAMLPVCYGINFGQPLLNQAGALVMIYTGMALFARMVCLLIRSLALFFCFSADGSVLVTHGGIEMGQGLYTKMAQIAAQVLCIPAKLVHVEETTTDKV
jgi:xanthine dehydrogenase/oxidase